MDMDSELLHAFAAHSSGEWAGWRCEFSAEGRHVPVPERFVPPEMLDWGAELTRVSVDRFERALHVSGSADTYALDVLEAGKCSLETIFAASSPPGKDDKTNCRDTYRTLARRIRVETTVRSEGGMWRLTALQMSVERKWHVDGFSLDVSPIVDTVDGGRITPSGLSLDEIHSAVASDCFEVSGVGMGEDGRLRLPLGVSVMCGETWLEVAFKDKTGMERILRRFVMFRLLAAGTSELREKELQAESEISRARDRAWEPWHLGHLAAPPACAEDLVFEFGSNAVQSAYEPAVLRQTAWMEAAAVENLEASASVDPTSTIGRERASKKNVKITGSFLRASSENLAHRHWARLQAAVQSYWLANFMAALILIDAYCTMIDIDATAERTTPPQIFAFISDFCLVVYTLEVAALTACFGWRMFLSDGMMILDVVIVGCGWAEKLISSLADGALGFRTAVLRALRLVRIFRLMRLLKRIRPLRELHKLVMMMATCFRALLWSFLLCFVVMTVWAMLMVEVVNPHVQEMHRDPNLDVFNDCHPQCTRAVSSVMYANLLLFKTVIAGDSWGEIAVPVIQEHPATAVIFIGSSLTLVFGVLNLIVAVVVDTFADARLNDVQNLAEEMEDEIEHDRKALGKLFARIDKDGSGQLSLQELIEGARHDSGFQSRLRVMDIDEQDLEQLFHMIDIDQSGTIEVAEFIGPLSRWAHDSKTAPRFIKYNMIQTMHLQEDLYDLSVECFQQLAARVEDLSVQVRMLKQGNPKGHVGQGHEQELSHDGESGEVQKSDSLVSESPTEDLQECQSRLDPGQSGSRSHSLNTSAWLTHHGKLEAPLVHQPPSSHQVEFLEPQKALERSTEAAEALLDAAMSRLEAKLDLLLAESRARPRDALHPGVGSEEMGIFAKERKQRKKGGKKMLHPEAFRSMYMNHGRQISMLDLRAASDPDGHAPRRRSLRHSGHEGGFMSFARQMSPFQTEDANFKPVSSKGQSGQSGQSPMDI
ncbi:Sodium channel protein type 11 subunit alpha [Symbiodinium microadriaticum]|uniref:Sodium channel protein type 11 subunit alpha n=1 Tax=Symbiodinium microadriaticum TaxID=2951 RepID=A0A1Q9EBU4_SYMMI|nr:Sodium channel protein type 11 subunit alpha [Symbiodinium microadriaticum]